LYDEDTGDQCLRAIESAGVEFHTAKFFSPALVDALGAQ
jgi:hypothetical protein